MNDKPVLRELSVGELLDKAFRLYRSHFLTLIGITALLTIPGMLLEILAAALWQSIQVMNILQNLIFGILMNAALITAISSFYLTQPATSIQQALRLGAKRYLSILGSSLLMGLAMAAPLILILIFALARSIVLTLISYLGLLVFMVFLSNRWGLSHQAILLEGKGAVDGLQRSWTLTQKYFWRVLGTSTAAGLIVSLVTSLPTFSLSALTRSLSIPLTQALILNAVFSQLLAALITPFSVAVSVLIYYDLRIRAEAFDLEYAADSAFEKTS